MNSHLCEFWDVIKSDLHEEVFNRFLKIILCMQEFCLHTCMHTTTWVHCSQRPLKVDLQTAVSHAGAGNPNSGRVVNVLNG